MRPERRDPSAQPNVIFILADDLGYGDLGAYGNRVVQTPNIDALAEGGAKLTQHYTASPLCAPARAALLTGRYNHRTGAVDVPSNRGLDRIALSERTLGDVLGNGGYATGMAGKWHNGVHDLRFHPMARGFDEFAGFLNGGMDYYRWVLDRNGTAESADGRYLTDVLTDEAVSFMRRHVSHPFFYYLAYNAPHTPYQAPDAIVERYRARGDLTDEVSILYAMIEVMDAGVGRIVHELRRLGIEDNTIVVFSSDNGPFLAGALDRFNGHYRGAKGDAFEGGIRVPGIIRWPDGVPSAYSTDAMVHFCDWLPTLASFAGVEVPEGHATDGRDVSSLLRGGDGDGYRIRYWQRNRYEPLARCNGAMRDGPWKLVWPMLDGGDVKDAADNDEYRAGLRTAHRVMPIQTEIPERPVETPGSPILFRIDEDPREDVDIAADHPERVEAMVRAWDVWFDEMLSQWREAYNENILD